MIDPLSVLKHYIVNRKEIVESKHQFRFHEFAFAKNVKTNFFHLVFKGSSMRVMVKEYYTLECLVFLLKNVRLRHPQYVQKALVEKVPIIRRLDRKIVLAYLYGLIGSSNRIDDKDGPRVVPSLVDRSVQDQEACTVVHFPTQEEVSVQLASLKGGLAGAGQVEEEEEERDRVRRCSLSDVLTAEHIEAIKQKFRRARRARKQHRKKKINAK